MDYKIEVVTLSVRDVHRSLSFYAEKVGFRLDVDYGPTTDFRVIQLTPPGSACSVQFGVGLTDRPPGATRETYLVVEDIELARRELMERGVEVGEIRHKSPVDTWRGGWEPNVDPEHRDYSSSAQFTDPDGHGWVLQERGYRANASHAKAQSNSART